MSLTDKKYNLLFVVCHPDDEAVWIGGIITELSRFKFLRIYVLCLSGGNANSVRLKEFKAAQRVAGYYKGIVLDYLLRPALKPLPNITKSFEKGLSKLQLAVENISLLITHSPYGDEHAHPHHKQAFQQLYDLSKNRKIPFGFFSCLPLPYIYHQSLLTNYKRHETLHVLNFSRCYYPFRQLKRLFLRHYNINFNTPKYYLQFISDMNNKNKMLNCYQSTDLKQFKIGYAAFTSNSESIYLFDDMGVIPFKQLFSYMQIPGSKNLF